MMHEITTIAGAELIVRANTVDRDNVEWMSQSLFVAAMRSANIAERDIVLDFGSHIGSFSVVAAREKKCRVVGFEPDAASIRVARASVLINGLEGRVEFHSCAVGEREGTALLHEATENWGHTIVDGGGPYNRLTGRTTEVRLIALSQALRHAPDGCAFLKFNIEGAEHRMFEMAPRSALHQIRVMAGEVHYDLGRGNVQAWVRKLEDCGFRVELVPQGELRAILLARRQ